MQTCHGKTHWNTVPVNFGFPSVPCFINKVKRLPQSNINRSHFQNNFLFMNIFCFFSIIDKFKSVWISHDMKKKMIWRPGFIREKNTPVLVWINIKHVMCGTTWTSPGGRVCFSGGVDANYKLSMLPPYPHWGLPDILTHWAQGDHGCNFRCVYIQTYFGNHYLKLSCKIAVTDSYFWTLLMISQHTMLTYHQ